MEDNLIVIHTLTSRFEADLLLDALEQEGIPALLRSFEETPYDGLFVPQRGWGKILVPEALEAKATAIIQPLLEDLKTRKLYDDPAETDPLLWASLQQAEPGKICRNAMVRCDGELPAYVVPFLNAEFRCFPDRELIEPVKADSCCELDFQFYLVILHYLLESRSEGLSGKWVSEQDIPGGSLFFRGPHQLLTRPLVKLFGTRPEVFRPAAEQLGGTPTALGDQAYRFWALPRVPLLYIFWRGDEEFEPVINIRFDATISSQFRSLDSIWALVNVVSRTLLAAGKSLVPSGAK
jgi:hypothetical protein